MKFFCDEILVEISLLLKMNILPCSFDNILQKKVRSRHLSKMEAFFTASYIPSVNGRPRTEIVTTDLAAHATTEIICKNIKVCFSLESAKSKATFFWRFW